MYIFFPKLFGNHTRRTFFFVKIGFNFKLSVPLNKLLLKDFVDHAFNTHPKSIDPLQNEITDGSLNDIQLPDVSEIDNENIKTEEADSVPGKLIINQMLL